MPAWPLKVESRPLGQALGRQKNRAGNPARLQNYL